MGNTLERREHLTHAKTGYKNFVNNNGDIPSETMYHLSDDLSQRMKELIMSTMHQIHNWKDAIWIFRAHLSSILKDSGTFIDVNKKTIELPGLKRAGYDLTSYDNELIKDFPPYANPVMRFSVVDIKKPDTDNTTKGQLITELSFPHNIAITDKLPKQILDHIIAKDPTTGDLPNAPWLGYMDGSFPYDPRTPLIQLALERIFKDYAKGAQHTDILLSPGAADPFLEKDLHNIMNEILQGIVEIELLNQNTLRYHVLPGQL